MSDVSVTANHAEGLIGTNVLEDGDSRVYYTTWVHISEDHNLNSAFYINCPLHCHYYWLVFTV